MRQSTRSSSRGITPSARASLTWIGLVPLGLACGLVTGCAVQEQDEVSPPASDADGSPSAAVMPHWDALIARSGGVPAVRWGNRGTPMSLFGNLSDPRGSVLGDGARGFLADNAPLFQLSTDLAELHEPTIVESPLGTHVAFAQRYEGVRVFGAEVKVHFSADGRIVAVNNTSVPRLALD